MTMCGAHIRTNLFKGCERIESRLALQSHLVLGKQETKTEQRTSVE